MTAEQLLQIAMEEVKLTLPRLEENNPDFDDIFTLAFSYGGSAAAKRMKYLREERPRECGAV